MATQLKQLPLPIKQAPVRCEAQAITDADRKRSVYCAMRVARADAKLVGVREKRARLKAEEDKMKKK